MESQDRRRPPGNFALVLIGIFAAAVAVTLFVGLRGDNSSAATDSTTADAEIPDLGDIADNNPDTPSDLEPAPVAESEPGAVPRCHG